MSKSVLHSKRSEAFQLISIPAGVVIVVSLLLLIVRENDISRAVFLGGLVWLVPNLYFAVKVFSTGGAHITPQQMLKNFYLAEVTKLVLCAVLFTVIVKFLAVAVLAMLAGFVMAQVSFWMSPFLLSKMRRLIK